MHRRARKVVIGLVGGLVGVGIVATYRTVSAARPQGQVREITIVGDRSRSRPRASRSRKTTSCASSSPRRTSPQLHDRRPTASPNGGRRPVGRVRVPRRRERPPHVLQLDAGRSLQADEVSSAVRQTYLINLDARSKVRASTRASHVIGARRRSGARERGSPRAKPSINQSGPSLRYRHRRDRRVSQPALAIAVREIEDHAERHPDDQALPRTPRQAEHQAEIHER